MEICFLAEGRQIYRVNDQTYTLGGGDVFLTFPDEVHDTGSFPEGKGILYWLILKIPDKGEGFIIQNPDLAESWWEALTSIESRYFKGSNNMQNYLDKVIASCEAEHKKINKIVTATYLSVFLLELLECAGKKEKREVSLDIRRAIVHINNHLENQINIENLADIAGLSADWFKEKFRKEMGLSPADFINRCKVEYSKELLNDQNKSVTDVAFQLGFSSSQYFATVFKRYTGQTPTAFRDRE